MQAKEVIVQFPEKLEPIRHPYRLKGLFGGRGGAKSRTVAGQLILDATDHYEFVLCTREVQNSIKESVKRTLEDQIHRMQLTDLYKITEYEILNLFNKSRFIFMGLARNISSIKSIEGITKCWVEEAQTISEDSLEILIPTIREAGSEIWFTWNPRWKTDAVDDLFRGENGPPPNSLVIEIGYKDNPWFPAELEEKRLWDQKHNPNYLNIWEGAYRRAGDAYSVLPYEKLLLCVDAHKKLKIEPEGLTYSGLDIADEGNDTNSYAMRKGSLLFSVEEWKVKYLHMTAAKADLRNRHNGVVRMHYDAGGMGAGIKSDLSRIPKNPEDGQGPDGSKFIPFHFGGKVKGADRVYIKAGKTKVLNKDFFARLNAQAWWNIRLRVENTIKALDGEIVNLDRCLFISSEIKNLDKLLMEMAQCVYDDSSGKIKIDKQPDNAPSPNMADSVIMAFASDLRKGLRV